MQFKTWALFALLCASVQAAPHLLKRAPKLTDIQILNYALTLEFLEDAFYTEGLSRFDEETFHNAGLNRSLFLEIAEHESSHVHFLQNALGDQATKACKYSFPFTDIKSFVSLSMILEGVGVTAYLGAAGSITNKDYLTAAGAILTTEARHNTWISSVANGQTPWSGDFDTPMGFNQVYSLAAPMITECPTSNPVLPLKAFPALNITSPSYSPGSKISLEFEGIEKSSKSLFVAFLHGLTPTFVPYDPTTKETTVPANLTGTAYAVVTTSHNVTDDSTVAGPAILMFNGSPTNSSASPSATSASGNVSGGGNSGGTAHNAAGRLMSQTLGVLTGLFAASFILMV